MSTDPSAADAEQTCWCGSAFPASQCCAPILRGAEAPSAEALMRSRYSAFVTGNAEYLLRTWHESTRPDAAALMLDDGMTWRRLQIVDTTRGGPGDDAGVVEFRASYRDADGVAGLLHERSRFVRVDGEWRYVDGDILAG